MTAAGSRFFAPTGLFASKFLRPRTSVERRSGKRLRSIWKSKNFMKPK